MINSFGDITQSLGDVTTPFGGPGPAGGGLWGPGGGSDTGTTTRVRVGLGTVSIASGLLQGTLQLEQTVEQMPQGSGTPITILQRIISKQRSSISFETTGFAGVSVGAGPQTAETVGFTFGGSGPGYSAALQGFLTSAEFHFSETGVAVCKLAYEAQGGALTGGGSSGGATNNALVGLGTISGAGVSGGMLLAGTVSASIQPTFCEGWGGTPLTLGQRDITMLQARITASLRDFGSVSIGSIGDTTFRHPSGASITINNAMLIRATPRFTAGGQAVLDCEWVGTGLEAG